MRHQLLVRDRRALDLRREPAADDVVPWLAPPRLDGLLAMRGVVETVDEED